VKHYAITTLWISCSSAWKQAVFSSVVDFLSQSSKKQKKYPCWKEAFIGHSPSVYNSINAVIINITFFRIFNLSAFIAESARNSRFLAFLNFTSNTFKMRPVILGLWPITTPFQHGYMVFLELCDKKSTMKEKKNNLFPGSWTWNPEGGDGVVFRRCDIIAEIADSRTWSWKTVRSTWYARWYWRWNETIARCSGCRVAVEAWRLLGVWLYQEV